MASFLDALLGRSQRAGAAVRPTGNIGEEAGGALRQLLVGVLTGRNPGTFRDQFDERNARTRQLQLQDALEAGDVNAISRIDPRVAAAVQEVQGGSEESRRRRLGRFARTAGEDTQAFFNAAGDLVSAEERALIEQGGPQAALSLFTEPDRTTPGSVKQVTTQDGVFLLYPDGRTERIGARPASVGSADVAGSRVIFDPNTGQPLRAITPEDVFASPEAAPQEGGPALREGQPVGGTLGDIAVRQSARETEARKVAEARGATRSEDIPLSASAAAKLRQSHANTDARLVAAQRQLDSIAAQAGPFSTGPAALTAALPGSPAANLQARLKSLTGNIITREVEELKRLAANGSTGFGQLTELEAERIAQAFAALDATQSPAQFKSEVAALQRQVNESRARIKAATEEELARRAPQGPRRITLDEFLQGGQ